MVALQSPAQRPLGIGGTMPGGVSAMPAKPAAPAPVGTSQPLLPGIGGAIAGAGAGLLGTSLQPHPMPTGGPNTAGNSFAPIGAGFMRFPGAGGQIHLDDPQTVGGGLAGIGGRIGTLVQKAAGMKPSIDGGATHPTPVQPPPAAGHGGHGGQPTVAGAGGQINTGVPGAISTFGAGGDLRNKQILPGQDPRLAATERDVNAARDNLAGGPDRFQLAQDRYKQFLTDSAPGDFDALRALRQSEASSGRVGSSMEAKGFADLGSRIQAARSSAQNQFMTNALEGTIQDRRNNLSDLSGLEGQQFDQGQASRNEYRGERGYQAGQAQQSWDNNRTRTMDEEALTQGQWNRDEGRLHDMTGLGYQGDPSGTMLDVGRPDPERRESVRRRHRRPAQAVRLRAERRSEPDPDVGERRERLGRSRDEAVLVRVPDMSFFGSLIRAGVSAGAGALKGQNEGDDENYRRQEIAKKDKLEEEHYQNEELLRRYAAERSQQEADATTATWRTREGSTTTRSSSPSGSVRGTRRSRRGRPTTRSPSRASRSTTPIAGPSGGSRAIRALPSGRPTSPATSSARAPGGTPEQKITDLNAAIDDKDREVGRAEHAMPKPYSELPEERRAITTPADSAAYEDNYNRAAAAVDSLRSRRDRFASTRDSIVGARHGMSSPSSQPAGVDPANLSAGAGHTSGTKPRPATPTMAPELPGGGQVYGDPAMSAALEEINRQYQDNLNWRGPNGERKNPDVLRQRYLEAMAHVTGTSK
jgi:hypothetical protein